MNTKKANKKNNVLSQERLFNMKKFFLFVLALSVCALSADDSVEERVSGLQAQIDRAMSKAGIHVSGEFRSQFLNSTLDGDAVGDGKKNESVEYTSVDFNIVARPNTALSARAMFRLHQDWRNFFSDVQNPITTRWLSVDGSLMQGIFKFNIGDYSRKLTPLTLWAPDLEFLYEPEIFAQNRRLAMSEAFVGDNNRALQGVNIEFKAELYPILHEVSADVFGARLAAAGTGESGVTPPGTTTVNNGEYWDARYDKYLLGVNVGTQIVKGAEIGVSDIFIFDYVNSYGPGTGAGAGSGRQTIDSVEAKLNAQATNIIAGRGKVDTRIFMEDDFINVGLNVEAALSSDNRPELDPNDNKVVLNNAVNGMAVNLGLTARAALGEDNTLKLSAGLIYNDTAFRNEAAQSPTFVQRAIMNNENALEGLGLLNPFDALYRSVFKYTPSQYFGDSKPYTKNAYTNSVLSPRQMAGIDANEYLYPSFFQAALPGGMATANRVGPVGKFNGSFLDEGVTVGVKAAMLTTYAEYEGMDKPEFQEIVVGAGLNIAKFAPVIGPSLQIGGSFGMYNTKEGGYEANNSLISVGLDYNFIPRFSLLVGGQLLKSFVPPEHWETAAGDRYDVKYDYEFSHAAFGLSYKVADGGVLTLKISVLTGKKTSSEGTVGLWDANANNGEGDYTYKPFVDDKNYMAFQPEVYLTVKF
jgi:hypothetical protein